MDIEERINAIEADLQQTKDELKDILFDIRTYLMEVQSPIPNDLNRDKGEEELKTERG
jgi:NTP pyrophosphatase (non-canonical NTP hydrolase)